jgi:hypothetical protein
MKKKAFNMRAKIFINEPDVINNQQISEYNYRNAAPSDVVEKKSNIEILAKEGSKDFADYVEWLGFSHDPNLIVLSSLHHYYYDSEEMKSIRTVVNLIELNQIKDVNDFIHSMFHIMPAQSYLIGCFVDNKKQSRFALNGKSSDYRAMMHSQEVENGITSRIPILNMLFSFLDSKTNKYISGKVVSLLLGSSGYKVLDMTEINGRTYFCAQRQPVLVKKSPGENQKI